MSDEGGKRKLISFKYERLPNFCYVCGKLDHLESECSIAIKAIKNGQKLVKEYGPWLRAESVSFISPEFQEKGPKLSSTIERNHFKADNFNSIGNNPPYKNLQASISTAGANNDRSKNPISNAQGKKRPKEDSFSKEYSKKGRNEGFFDSSISPAEVGSVQPRHAL